MGRMKFRQGHLIDVGLPQNYEEIKPVVYQHKQPYVMESRVGWMMAIIHAITKPFVRVVNNYRGRGQR